MRQTDYLKYINYSFTQDSDLFKVNTDTTVLGMFLDRMDQKSVLDIGTNTGALLLYAHARGAKQLIGVDIHQEALSLARENLKAYSNDFTLYHSYIQDLKLDPVDVIICNPPFYEVGDVRMNKYYQTAMYEKTMPLNDMFSAFRRYLKDNGCVYTLYPAERFPELYQAILTYKFKIMKMQFVHDEKRPYASRVVLKLKIGKMTKLKVNKPIMIRGGEIELS